MLSNLPRAGVAAAAPRRSSLARSSSVALGVVAMTRVKQAPVLVVIVMVVARLTMRPPPPRPPPPCIDILMVITMVRTTTMVMMTMATMALWLTDVTTAAQANALAMLWANQMIKMTRTMKTVCLSAVCHLALALALVSVPPWPLRDREACRCRRESEGWVSGRVYYYY